MMSDTKSIRILFVCTANICRSPLAENLLRHQAEQRGVIDHFVIDSAGTGRWRVGDPPDHRMCALAQQNGIEMRGEARQITRDDIDQFDLIMCMDENNLEEVLALGGKEKQVHRLLDFHGETPLLDVPDPYTSGPKEFEMVYALVDQACDRLLDQLVHGR